jgi:hypothetical protein
MQPDLTRITEAESVNDAHSRHPQMKTNLFSCTTTKWPPGRLSAPLALRSTAIAYVDCRALPPARWSEGLEPCAQEAEFVAFWVGQNVPTLGTSLADVGWPGAESKQSLQFGVLIAVEGVDVDMQSELPGPRIAARTEDEGWLRAAEADVGRSDLDAAVILPAELDVTEDLAPE